MSAISLDEPQRVVEPAHPPMYVETVLRLFHKGATAQLQRIIGKLLPADMAQVIHASNDLEDAAELFDLVTEPLQAAKTLKELSEEYQSHIMSTCTLERAVGILEKMPPDTRSDIIGMLSPEVGDHLMNALTRESQKEVQDLLQYLPDTAGSLMTSSFFTLPADTTASAAVQAVREQPSQEFMYYVYLVDDSQRLVGVSSIRQMLLCPASKLLRDVMETRVHRVNVDTPQEEAAKLVTRHGLMAIPVVNDQGVLRGIITVDDLIDVIQDADTDAMLKSKGVDVDSNLNILTQHILSVARTRIPWLAAPFLGGLLAAWVLGLFEGTMAKVIQLSFFMPMIFGMAGNVGSQAAMVAVRGLATGVIGIGDYVRLLIKESSVGLLVGAFYGLCLSTYAYLMFKSGELAFVVGISILSNITYAGVIAATLPLMLQRMGHDPAVGGGPYVLTTIDVLGVINYLIIAALVFGF